jgi:hypothetical protein
MDLMIKLRSEVMRKSLLLKSVKIRQFHPFTFHPPPRRIHPSRAFTPPAPKHFFSPPTPSPVPSAVPFHPPHSSAPTRSGSRPPEASAFTPAPPSPGALPRCSSAAASQAPPFSRSGEIQAGARCREGEAGHGRRGGRAGPPRRRASRGWRRPSPAHETLLCPAPPISALLYGHGPPLPHLPEVEVDRPDSRRGWRWSDGGDGRSRSGAPSAAPLPLRSGLNLRNGGHSRAAPPLLVRAPAELGGRSCEYIHSTFQSHLLLCELLASSHSRFVDSGVFSSGLTQRGMAVCPLPPPLLHLSSRCSPKPSPGVRACIPCGSSIRMNGASRWRCNGWWPDFI